MAEAQATGPGVKLLPLNGVSNIRLIHKKIYSVDLSAGKTGLFLFPGEAEISRRGEWSIAVDSGPGELVIIGALLVLVVIGNRQILGRIVKIKRL